MFLIKRWVKKSRLSSNESTENYLSNANIFNAGIATGGKGRRLRQTTFLFIGISQECLDAVKAVGEV